jgi:hypothetical protein
MAKLSREGDSCPKIIMVLMEGVAIAVDLVPLLRSTSIKGFTKGINIF